MLILDLVELGFGLGQRSMIFHPLALLISCGLGAMRDYGIQLRSG